MDTLSTDLGRIKIFDVLSFDLLSTIFSELTRNDVLECMLVSRQWQRCVPHYASQWFRRIVLNGRGDLDLYSSFMQAVGQFAQVVVLESFSSSSTSHKAVTEILPRFFPNVETLHMKNSYINEDLGMQLRTLPALSRLMILDPSNIHLSPVSIRNILYFCSNMISMTISGNARPSVFIRNAFSRHVISHLQYLDVSNYNISIHALQPLLMACPNLEYLAVCSEGYGIENKAILATCCPRLRHLYYRPFHVKGSIRPFTLYHNHDHDEDRPSNTNQMSLRGLHIDDVDAIHFLDQRQIAHLHLEHNWSRMNVSALRSVYRLMDQNARTLVLLDLALSPDMLEALIPSFNSFIRLTSLRISIYLDLRFTSVVNLNQINAMAAHHPTLNYIAVSVIRNPFFNPVINIRPPFISEIASIPHLKQIEWLSLHTPAITLTQLFRTATELERVIVRIGSLTLSWEMFDALVRLPLDTLELASVEQPRLLPDALHGLRHFIDHHAGPLSSMTISGCICSDRDYDAIAYAYQKLGPRFKFHRVSH